MMPQLRIVETLACDRCSGESYLTVQIPHPSYLYPELQPEFGILTFHLCPQCDKDNAHAHGLLAYFACHSKADTNDVDGFGSLVNEWVTSLSQTRNVDPQRFEADVDSYRRGEYG